MVHAMLHLCLWDLQREATWEKDNFLVSVFFENSPNTLNKIMKRFSFHTKNIETVFMNAYE